MEAGVKRWDERTQQRVERPEIDAFLSDLVAVYRRHGFALEHEDGQGAFVVRKISDEAVAWLMDAMADDGGGPG